MKTYNFIEAVNSGKRFKPEGLAGDGWLWIHPDKVQLLNAGHVTEINLDIVMAQFVLEEEEYTFTESQLEEVLKKVNITTYHNTSDAEESCIDEIKKGLKKIHQ